MDTAILSPAQVVNTYGDVGGKKCQNTPLAVFLLAILAGALIAFAGAATNTAAHTAGAVGTVRLICALLFPFGLAIVILMGAELFTGNCLIAISVLQKKASLAGMLKNWIIVYSGNFLGSVLVAALCAYCGQFNYSGGELAVFTMSLAAGKCSLSFANGLFLGAACNVLVCLGVLCAMTAKDTTGKILGAFVPVALFVLCGFEHSVANMYYVPAGLFAKSDPAYAALAAEAGLDLTELTWSNFLLRNLVPVTLGNILGGSGIGILLYLGHNRKS